MATRVAPVGVIDMPAQAEWPSARRSDTPTQVVGAFSPPRALPETLARLIAAEVADEFCIAEVDSPG
jgi:hypothetical protein